MQFSVLIFSLVTIAQKTASQHADEWHFSWNESKKWNALRETKIFENTRMFDTREAGGQNLVLDRGGTEGSNLIGGLPVYVSLTTISKRLHLLGPTIQSIIVGSVVPSMIYIFISTDPHLIDTGICEDDFMDEQTRLVDLLHFFHNIKFVFTENIGPHRKVLPLLYHKWDEDCVIISVDDDHIYSHHWLRDMLAYYVHSKGQAIISTRARRIAICSGQAPFHVAPYMHAIGTATVVSTCHLNLIKIYFFLCTNLSSVRYGLPYAVVRSCSSRARDAAAAHRRWRSALPATLFQPLRRL